MNIWLIVLLVVLIVGASGLWRIFYVGDLQEDDRDEHETLGI